MNLVSSVMKTSPKHQDNQSAECSSRLLCALYNQYANQVLISRSSATQRKTINNGRRNPGLGLYWLDNAVVVLLRLWRRNHSEQRLAASGCVHSQEALNCEALKLWRPRDVVKTLVAACTCRHIGDKRTVRAQIHSDGVIAVLENCRDWAESPAAGSQPVSH